MQEGDNHSKGLAIVLTGVLVLTPDALLIRLIGTDPWTLLVWRGFLQALGLLIILICFHGRATLPLFSATGRPGLLTAVIYAGSTFGFINALELTSVANVLIIVATSPFFAAVFTWLFLREAIALRTWLAILAALIGIIVLALDSLGTASLMGDLLALGGAVALGANFTVIRHARKVNMIPAMVVSGLLVGTTAWFLAPGIDLNTTQLGYMLIMGLFVIPISFALMTLGPRYLPAPEVSLLLLLETVLGPFWVWLVLNETPSPLALVGGSIVVLALLVHSALTRRNLMANLSPGI